MQTVDEPVVAAGPLPRRLWLATLALGALLWAAVAVAIALTDNTILVPNLLLLGTFLVPVCTVLFVLARPREAHVSVEVLVLGFLAGGTAGVVLTGTTGVYVLPDHLATNALTGVIEEGGQALILVAVATLVKVRVPRDGMVLGATIAAGFAAFESAGYAFGALIQYGHDHPLLNVLQTEAERAVLAPSGRITWSAILGGAIFASAWTTGRFRLDRRVL
jgi:RsiW-degrading membrane proteinase PrsW (M82 family)